MANVLVDHKWWLFFWVIVLFAGNFLWSFWIIGSPLVRRANKPENIPKRNKIFVVVKAIQEWLKLCNGWSERSAINPFILWNCQINLSLAGATDQAPTKLNNRWKFSLAWDSFQLFKQDNLLASLQKMLLFLHVSPLLPLLIVPVILWAVKFGPSA